MRTFILFASKAGTEIKTTDFSFGRFDLIARCINAALWKSHGLRDTQIHIVLGEADPTRVLTITNKIRYVCPDERSIVLWIQKVLAGRKNPGITLEECSFEKLLERYAKSQCYLLDESGKNMNEVQLDKNPVFILGDHEGIPNKEEKYVKKMQKIAIGPESYLGSHCISYMNITLDQQEGTGN